MEIFPRNRYYVTINNTVRDGLATAGAGFSKTFGTRSGSDGVEIDELNPLTWFPGSRSIYV